MPREYKVYLRDILEAIGRIERYTGNMNFEDFSNNELIQDGVIRNLEIIGEAAKNLPDDVKKDYPESRMEKDSWFEGYSYSCIFWCRFRGYMGHSKK